MESYCSSNQKKFNLKKGIYMAKDNYTLLDQYIVNI